MPQAQITASPFDSRQHQQEWSGMMRQLLENDQQQQPFKNSLPEQLMATHDDLTLLYAGPGHLRAMRQKNDVQTRLRFNCPESFSIVRRLSMNPTGKLLALVGEHGVLVVVLPSLSSTLNKDEIFCSSIRVGSFYHETDTGNRILQVHWHPASNGTHLMVLSSDGCLRLYNLSMNPADPESTFYLRRSAASIGRVFDYDLLVDDVVSFCFGSGPGWSRFTVYGLLRNGDILSLCPVVPVQGYIDIKELHDMYESSFSNYEEAIKTSNEIELEESLPPLADQFNNQLAFVKELLDSCISTHPSELQRFTFKNRSHLKPYLRGPYFTLPAPAEISDSADNATDLICCSVSGSGETSGLNMEVLAVAYDTGKLDLFLTNFDALTGGVWENSQHAIPDPELFAWETVDLELTRNNSHPISLHTTKASHEMIFVQHRYGVHFIFIGDWVQRLLDQLSTRSPHSTDSIASRLGRDLESDDNVMYSCVSTVVTTDFSHDRPVSIVGLGFPRESRDNHHLAVLTSDYRFIKCNMSEISPTLELMTELGSSDDVLSKQSVLDSASLESSLGLPSASLTSLLRELPLNESFSFIQYSNDRRKITIGQIVSELGQLVVADKAATVKYPECVISKEMLSQFSQRSTQIRENIKTLRLIEKSIQTRIDVFKSESGRMDSVVASHLDGLIAHLEKTLQATKERIRKVADDDERLVKRADLLIQLAMELNQPDLTEQERAWLKELLVMKEKSMKELAARVDKVKNQMNIVLQKRDADTKKENTPSAGAHQVATINQLIKQESDFIEDVRKRVLEIEEKLALLEQNE